MENRIYFEKFGSEQDFEYFLALTSNEQVMNMNYGRVFTLEESQNYYKHLLNKNEKSREFGHFKVFERETDLYIGLGALSVNQDLTEGELEYMLLPEYWGKGYGSEIAESLLNKSYEVKSLQRVKAIIDPNNKASKRILLKLGFESRRKFEIDDGSKAEEFVKELLHSMV